MRISDSSALFWSTVLTGRFHSPKISSCEILLASPTELKEIQIDNNNQRVISEDYKRLWRNVIY